MEPTRARALWHRVEAINAVTYFARECREAPAALGLKGFWMGYFGCRAAPLGAVGPAVVEAAFFNFHPARVRRAIPDAWSCATPSELLDARAGAAAAALRRVVGEDADRLADTSLTTLVRIIDASSPAGRPLFAANRDVALPADPVAALWHACTTVREQRGDCHVALLTSAGLDGCEVHVLFAATEGGDEALLQESRGWSPEEWAAATDRLVGRGVLDRGGAPTPAGRDLHEQIERRTDELAAAPIGTVSDDDIAALLRSLTPAADRIGRSGEIPFPNPIGLPPAT